MEQCAWDFSTFPFIRSVAVRDTFAILTVAKNARGKPSPTKIHCSLDLLQRIRERDKLPPATLKKLDEILSSQQDSEGEEGDGDDSQKEPSDTEAQDDEDLSEEGERTESSAEAQGAGAFSFFAVEQNVSETQLERSLERLSTGAG